MAVSGVADRAPTEDYITAYDEQHITLYLRLLDAHRAKACPKEMCRLILHRDPDEDPASLAILESHLARAQWICARGYKDFLPSGK